MSEAHVTVVGDGDGEERDFTVRVNGDLANFEIKAERLEASFSKKLDNRLSDFLDIVSAIFAADSRVRRGTRLRTEFGKAWRRHMRIRFLVREPEFWNRPYIKAALTDAVLSMSDDTLDLEFEQAASLGPTQGMLDLGSVGPAFSADEVILFSGGLDSLAGAYERLASAPGSVILLSHISANKRIATARDLVQRLKTAFPGRILWVPVTAHLKNGSAKESTQRTRSLLFACLGYVTAKLSGARHIHFYENGIVSANLPISAQVIGTMASRTTHPQTIQRLGALLDAIDPGEVMLSNEYGSLTKAQVAKRLAERGGANFIRHSVSCSHVLQQTILHPHCGACSQCLDRRFGILAAGLAEHDPVEGYEIDVLVHPRPKDDDRILALDWARHALKLSEISDDEFLSSFGSELGRLVSATPERSASEQARSIVAMHRAHGSGVRIALSTAIKEHSDAIVRNTLPETSLLRMIVADVAALPPKASTVPKPILSLSSEDRTGAGRHPQRVSISGSAKSATVVIEDLGEVSGPSATPAWALKPFHLSDRAAGGDVLAFQFVQSGQVAESLGIPKQTVRQRVKRLRDEFALQYEAVEGVPPREHILIQNYGSRGYRIDPSYDVVDGLAEDPSA